MPKRTGISYTKKQIVFARDRWRCVYCGKEPVSFKITRRDYRPYVIPVTDDGWELEIDHVIPYKISRDNSIENLVTACQKCNNRKGAKILKAKFPRLRVNLYKKEAYEK